MKTLRYRIGNEVKPGILDQEGNIRDVSSLVKDWDNKNVTISKLNEVKKIDPTSLPLVENSDGYEPCVCKESIGKFICIGLNYSDHAEETGQKVPPEPIIFAKATSSVIGPNDDVEIPKKSVKSDWEVELGVIIGKEAFGGTGMNILNPALTARALTFFAYPTYMSGNQVWVSEASNVDGVSGETILGMLAAGNSTEQFGIMEMFIGNIPGSIAETSTLMVLIGAFILIYTGVGSWRIMVGGVLGAAITGMLFNL